MKNKLFYLLVLVALLLSACGGAPSAGTEAPSAATEDAGSEAAPAVVRIGWPGGPDTLNPGAAWLADSYTIYEMVYNTIYDFNLDGTFSLDIADSVDVSGDGTIYTFKIKSGVKWHDGQPMTAGDIAFTYNLYKAHDDFPTLNSYTTHFVSIEAPDDTTLVLTLDQAIPNIESRLVFLYILPEHIWKDHSEGNAATEFENLEMIGTGPFKMVEYKANEFVHLAKNDDFWGTKPKVDEVIFQTFQNQDALIQALKAGQIDMISYMPNTGVAALKNVENVKVVTGEQLAPELADIIFNQADPERCPVDAGGLCTGHPALRDRNVRLAMAHATDKQKLIDIVALGFASPGIALIPRGMGEWFNSEIKDYEFDPDKANKILDDAGYKDVDGDGIREMPDGSKSLTFRLNWTSTSTVGPREAELLGEMWKAIGIGTIPQAVDPDALTAQCCPVLDYDILLWSWVGDPDPDTLLIIPTTDQIETGYNETGYINERYDELYNAQTTELDPAKRKEMIWEMQKIIHDDVVYIIPMYYLQVQAYRTDKFKGWIIDQPKLALEDVSSLMVIEPVK